MGVLPLVDCAAATEPEALGGELGLESGLLLAGSTARHINTLLTNLNYYYIMFSMSETCNMQTQNQ
jgi:hypothetical protein